MAVTPITALSRARVLHVLRSPDASDNQGGGAPRHRSAGFCFKNHLLKHQTVHLGPTISVTNQLSGLLIDWMQVNSLGSRVLWRRRSKCLFNAKREIFLSLFALFWDPGLRAYKCLWLQRLMLLTGTRIDGFMDRGPGHVLFCEQVLNNGF